MKKKLCCLLLAAALSVCLLYGNDSKLSPLEPGEKIFLKYEWGIPEFTKGRTFTESTDWYKAEDHGYSVQFSNGSTKAWFAMKEGLYCLDGITGTVSRVAEFQTPYIVSADGTKILYQDHTILPPWDNTRKEIDFYFYVLDTATGTIIKTITWNLYNWGDEMELRQTEDPGVIAVNYKPAGLFYADARFDWETLTLTVLRDDSHLSYSDLPKKYRESEHP